MKRICSFLSIFLTILSSISPSLFAVDSTFFDYQNYNHGYCPECSCYPCKCGGNAQTDAPLIDEGGDHYSNDGDCPSCPSNAPADQNSCSTCPTNDQSNAPCKKPNPCDPAPVCGTQCGVSMCLIGLAIAVVAATASIIISSGNGSPAHL